MKRFLGVVLFTSAILLAHATPPVEYHPEAETANQSAALDYAVTVGMTNFLTQVANDNKVSPDTRSAAASLLGLVSEQAKSKKIKAHK